VNKVNAISIDVGKIPKDAEVVLTNSIFVITFTVRVRYRISI